MHASREMMKSSNAARVSSLHSGLSGIRNPQEPPKDLTTTFLS